MYLISVYFDEKTNKQLQHMIELIAKQTGNFFMIENKVPPHMTISSIEARSVEELMPSFELIKDRVSSGPIQIVSVGQLLPYVLYATPVLNEYLMELLKTVFDAYKDLPNTTISRFYQPYSWLPHITLGKKLDKEQMRTAFEIVQDHFAPICGKIEEIGLSRVNPHEDVERIIL